MPASATLTHSRASRNHKCRHYDACLIAAAKLNKHSVPCAGCTREETMETAPEYETPDKSIPVIPSKNVSGSGSLVSGSNPKPETRNPKLSPVCTKCKDKPAIVNKRTGKATHGLCYECWYGKFMSGLMESRCRRSKGGLPMPNEIITELCKFPGCKSPTKARGFCGKHYDQWRDKGIDGFPSFQPVKADRRSMAKPKKAPVKKFLAIPLAGYDIIDDLRDSGHVNMRPAELQALAYIVDGLQNDGYGKAGKTKE